jgi:hypothetical protein
MLSDLVNGLYSNTTLERLQTYKSHSDVSPVIMREQRAGSYQVLNSYSLNDLKPPLDEFNNPVIVAFVQTCIKDGNKSAWGRIYDNEYLSFGLFKFEFSWEVNILF